MPVVGGQGLGICGRWRRRSQRPRRRSGLVHSWVARHRAHRVRGWGTWRTRCRTTVRPGYGRTMTSEANRAEEPDDADVQVTLATGRRGQRLVLSGWISSHADTGTPGPHVHLGTNDGDDAVLKTSQIPSLID